MAIVIENPTAEAFFEALRNISEDEQTRLRQMLNQSSPETDEEAAWHQASHTAASRFSMTRKSGDCN